VSDFTPRATKPKNQDREALIEEIVRIVDADPSVLEGVQKLLPQDAKHITIIINIEQVTQQIGPNSNNYRKRRYAWETNV
jgi:hypothetical protein